MAAPGERGAGGTAEEAFLTFYSEVKQIEKRDSVLTPKNQIERLTRPGASYFNLNPFEVLQMDPEVTDEEIKKRFRQLSILVHPDKNQDDAERAQKAFEAVDKAYKLLLDQEQKKRALDVIQAGKEYVEHTVKEKKKLLKKEGKPTNVEEDDPEVFKQAVYKQTMKLFAELEIKRKEREAKEMHERCWWVHNYCFMASCTGSDRERRKSRLKRKPSESENGRRTLRRVGMAVWTAGETSRQIQKGRKKKKTGPS
ncbi:DnaJ-like subfamily C member 8 [Platysternon megacephalum]|uniref:DnaJ homolog subfamily C member 8 n=1 Tax=Platysternon megacephalum TaxID=55544 RepID=A0A4D9DVC4_9SAUR|nr:DnaJ-like subfamily C member 8 [Platysternon megacephalum]